MAARKIDPEDVPRPPCACGAPATCQVKLEVRRLTLERDSGAHSRAYWAPSYKHTTHLIETDSCDDCVKQNVRVTVAIQAQLAQAPKETP